MPPDGAGVPDPGGKERNPVDFFPEYGEDIQHILRNPAFLVDQEEWGSFKAFLFHLDRALAASGLSREILLFRGIDRDFSRTFLFMLDVGEKTGNDDFGSSLAPHLIRDPGYTLFTTDPGAILRELPAGEGEPRVIVAYLSRAGDPALLLDEQAGEVLYPRNATWVTTGATAVEWGDAGNHYQYRDGGMRMTPDSRLVWRRQDIALRRAPFILDDDRKRRAEQILSRAADTARLTASRSPRK